MHYTQFRANVLKSAVKAFLEIILRRIFNVLQIVLKQKLIKLRGRLKSFNMWYAVLVFIKLSLLKNMSKRNILLLRKNLKQVH